MTVPALKIERFWCPEINLSWGSETTRPAEWDDIGEVCCETNELTLGRPQRER